MVLSLASWAVFCSLSLGDPPGRPPPLTFDKHVDYVAWYNDFVSKGKKEKENAYELYKPLESDDDRCNAVPLPPSQLFEPLDRAQDTVWTAEENPRLVAYLQENRRFVEVFKTAQERRDYWVPCSPEEGRPLLHTRMRQSAGMDSTIKIILADATRRQPNQGDALIQAWSLVLGNADHLRRGQLGILLSTGARRREQVYNMVRQALSEKLLQSKEVERTFTMIVQADAGEAPLAGWCLIEWASFLDVMQKVSPDGKVIEAEIAYSNEPGRPQQQGPLPETRSMDPVKIVRLADEHFASLCKAIPGPFDVRTVRVINRLEEEHREKLKANGESPGYCVSNGGMYDLLLRAEAHRRGTLLCLAMHAHKEARGEWPKSLEEMAPPLGGEPIKKFLSDPYSGMDYVYKLENGQPLLYSTGADGIDDGGHHNGRWGDTPNGGDFVFWPYQEPLNKKYRR